MTERHQVRTRRHQWLRRMIAEALALAIEHDLSLKSSRVDSFNHHATRIPFGSGRCEDEHGGKRQRDRE
jgi:hypothetical protein